MTQEIEKAWEVDQEERKLVTLFTKVGGRQEEMTKSRCLSTTDHQNRRTNGAYENGELQLRYTSEALGG